MGDGSREWRCSHKPGNDGNHQKPQEARNRFSLLENLQKEPADDTLSLALISDLYNCKRIHLCCFKPWSLYSFVTTATKNEYSGSKDSEGNG